MRKTITVIAAALALAACSSQPPTVEEQVEQLLETIEQEGDSLRDAYDEVGDALNSDVAGPHTEDEGGEEH